MKLQIQWYNVASAELLRSTRTGSTILLVYFIHEAPSLLFVFCNVRIWPLLVACLFAGLRCLRFPACTPIAEAEPEPSMQRAEHAVQSGERLASDIGKRFRFSSVLHR